MWRKMTEVSSVILELIERYSRNKEYYESTSYNEASLRREFIDRLFEVALGWDMTNRAGLADAYKDVVHEDAIRIGKAHKAPDYCFRIGGVRKFFLEAKKPHVQIQEDPISAYQLRRYAWSSNMHLSILTNFKEFAVYDCRIRPKPEDRANVARILYLTYESYPRTWEQISNIFSKDAILKGLFDNFAESTKSKKGISEVNHEFLEEIEGWRDAFARNIAIRNPALTVDELNFVVQRTIDRIIFLRMCEDRGIEKYEQLKKISESEKCYNRLFKIFETADDKYNSGLFHFRKEKNREELTDSLTPNLIIDDKVLKEVINRLYYPESPFEFSILPPDILGSVYEQFLGKIIRLTFGHHAKVEEKPEVKKAGGVYYTPSYIVDFIVRNTIGPLVEGKKPKQIEGIKILDPACGSGSFLVNAYSFLLDYHLQWYLKDGVEKHPNQIFQGRMGQYFLSTREKKRILLNNIFGVDIDSQASEVTKLNLLLKVLENENQDTLEWQKKLFQERALPDLGLNIKCGNSLIGTDFYKEFQTTLFEEDRVRINCFDWQTEYRDIMESGGFDAIIGNPPWGADFSKDELNYLRTRHQRVIARMIDSYIYFFDKVLLLAKSNAPVGFIIPSTLLNQTDVTPLRKLLLERGITHLISMGKDIFSTKVLNTSTIIISSKRQRTDKFIMADLSPLSIDDRKKQMISITASSWSDWKEIVEKDPHYTFFVNRLEESELLNRLRDGHVSLKNFIIGDIERGISPDLKEAFVVTESQAKSYHLEQDLLRHSVSGDQIKRYQDWRCDQLIIYANKSTQINNYPHILKHLSNFKDQITCKEVIEKKHPWWALHRSRNPEIFKSPKFIGLTTSKSINLVYDADSDVYVTDAMYVFRIRNEFDPWAFMAIMHSKLFLFLYSVANQGESRVIPQIKASKLSQLPFPTINMTDPIISKLSSKCIEIISLKRKLMEIRTPDKITQVNRQIDSLEEEIDQLVYSVYGLTEEEIKIVEK